MTSTEAGRSGMEELAGSEPSTPWNDWRALADALRRMLAGERLECEADVKVSLIAYGLLEMPEVTKPCRTCGRPSFDYRYEKVTAAGRLLVSALQNQGNPSTGKGVGK